MIPRFEFVSGSNHCFAAENPADAMTWIADHCRKVAGEHMALAEKVEVLMGSFLDNLRFRTGLRTFARHHRRAAWQHLEMAHRAEASLQTGCNDFDLADVVSAAE